METKQHHGSNRTTQDFCASADDFQKLFAKEMEELFCLAFLITADCAKAEAENRGQT